MEEQGIITKIRKDKAIVKIDKKDECSKCGMCLFPANASSIELECYNKASASVGDTVIISRQVDGKLLGALLVFLVPLILIGVAVLLSYLVIKNELFTLVIGIPLVILWYVALSFIDKKIKTKKNFTPVVVQIINSNSENK